MAEQLRITGEVTTKVYRCRECGAESQESTNHYGEIYRRCRSCSWKSPMESIKVFECVEPLPEGWEKPAPWKIVRLADVVEAL